MFEDNQALTNTRYASQVCRVWRTTTLEEPILWARLLDFNTLHSLRSSNWAQELICRSKTAPLWIKAEESRFEMNKNWYRSINPYTFLLSVIDAHWDRIQKLVLNADVLMHSDVSSCPIYRPAPLLDTFLVQFSRLDIIERPDFMHQFVYLFGGRAPMLRHFSAYHQKINYNGSWWHNLRSLSFGGVDNICEILTMLSDIPNLEYLKAESSEEMVPLLPRSAVSLPKLKGLDLHLNFTEMAYALDSLAIPFGCSLNLLTTCRSDNEHSSKEHISCALLPVISSISQVSRRFFQSHCVQNLSIRCLDGSFEIYDNMDKARSLFRIVCQYCLVCPWNPSEIHRQFAFPEFTSITQLGFQYDSCGFDFSPHDLAFLQCFSSVEILHVYEKTLGRITVTQDFLSHTENGKTVLFPKLRRIILHSLYVPNIPGKVTVNFILSRIEDGVPILILDITKFDNDVTSPTIIRLQFIQGLKVNFHSYIVRDVEPPWSQVNMRRHSYSTPRSLFKRRR